MKTKWTKKSYNATFNWLQKEKRAAIKRVLLADGLNDVEEKKIKKENKQ